MNIELARRLKHRRKELDITPERLAKLAGVTPNAILAYERGQMEVPNDVLPSLARSLSASTDWLFGLSNQIPPKQAQKLTQLEQAISLEMRKHPRVLKQKVYRKLLHMGR